MEMAPGSPEEMQRDVLVYEGLAALKEAEELFVKQEIEMLQMLTCQCWEQPNKYSVFNNAGQHVRHFEAIEKTSCITRQCCGENRPFSIVFNDVSVQPPRPVFKIERKYRGCGWAVLPCLAHKVAVHYLLDDEGREVDDTNEDTLISKVKVPWLGGCCIPSYDIYNKDGEKNAGVSGPFCCVMDCCGADFDVNGPGGDKVGEIKKIKDSSLRDGAKNLLTKADNFSIQFPKDFPVETKVALLAATLQIDFQFFEDDRGMAQGRCCDVYCCGWACPLCPAFCCSKKNKDSEDGAPAVDEMER